jgi:hypothetical protein
LALRRRQALFNLRGSMSQPKPADHQPQSADPATPAIEPGFEVALHAFWAEKRNRNVVLGICAAILLGIVAWKGSEYFAAQQEQGVQDEYAKISDQPAKLVAFAEAHAGHALAGIALLQQADDKYSTGDYAAAATGYQKAAAALKNDALLGRARLGAAISQVSGSDKAAGEAALRALSADTALLKSVRAEATYHLASLALEAGNIDEVRKLVDQVSRIDASGPWSQRATALLAALPAGGIPVVSPVPSITFKPGK